MQSKSCPYKHIFIKSIKLPSSYQYLCFQIGDITWDFRTKIVYVFLVPQIQTMYPDSLNILSLIISLY